MLFPAVVRSESGELQFAVIQKSILELQYFFLFYLEKLLTLKLQLKMVFVGVINATLPDN